MSNREDRYRAAVALAQLILENPAKDDPLWLEQARDDIFDEVMAGRRNQAEMPAAMDRAREQIRGVFDENQRHSIGVKHLRSVGQ